MDLGPAGTKGEDTSAASEASSEASSAPEVFFEVVVVLLLRLRGFFESFETRPGVEAGGQK